jgi:hypothetical protein
MIRRFSSFLLLLSLMSCIYHDLAPNVPPVEEVCDPETSWQNDILPIMTASCATSGCHDGISRRDWTNYNEVKTYSASIKTRTQNKSMPFDGPLPQDQIDKIVCWVDNGALNN